MPSFDTQSFSNQRSMLGLELRFGFGMAGVEEGPEISSPAKDASTSEPAVPSTGVPPLGLKFPTRSMVLFLPLPFVSLSSFASFPPMTHTRLSSVSPCFLLSRLSNADSLGGNGGFPSHIFCKMSSSDIVAIVYYSHAPCCNSASRTYRYRSRTLKRGSLI